MPLTDVQRSWYRSQIQKVDPEGLIATVDAPNDRIIYADAVRSDESRHKPATPEEYVHALILCLLAKQYGYQPETLYHEKYVCVRPTFQLPTTLARQ